MTICCPERLDEAVRKACAVDDIVDALIITEKDKAKKVKFEHQRGKACRSLLQCLAARAFSDAQDNKTPRFSDNTDIVYANGHRIRAGFLRPGDLPVRETVLFDDIVQHSFFFREIYRDPRSHEVVEVYDRCWYIFPEGIKQEDADAIAVEDLPGLLNNLAEYRRTFDPDEADSARRDGRAVRNATLHRQGMCGGIIFHPNYLEGKPDGTGYWSTHT